MKYRYVKETGLCLDRMDFIYLSTFPPDSISLWGPRCPGTSSVDQVGLEHRDSPASVFPSASIKGVR